MTRKYLTHTEFKDALCEFQLGGHTRLGQFLVTNFLTEDDHEISSMKKDHQAKKLFADRYVLEKSNAAC